jgi:hypothetical protein
MSQVLDKQLHDAIEKLNTSQKKALLGLAKYLESKETHDHWKDENFVAEMDRRYNEYKTGKAKLVSLDSVEGKARVNR